MYSLAAPNQPARSKAATARPQSPRRAWSSPRANCRSGSSGALRQHALEDLRPRGQFVAEALRPDQSCRSIGIRSSAAAKSAAASSGRPDRSRIRPRSSRVSASAGFRANIRLRWDSASVWRPMIESMEAASRWSCNPAAGGAGISPRRTRSASAWIAFSSATRSGSVRSSARRAWTACAKQPLATSAWPS